MHHFLFETAIKFYQLSWNMTIPLLRFSRRLKEGYGQRTLLHKPPRADLWIQAASVGESYLALELVRHLNHPESLKILITTNTRQGRDILERGLMESDSVDNHNIDVKTAYFPFDSPAIMSRALSAVNPKLIVLLESELWPGLLTASRKKGLNAIVVNGRMTEKSLRRYLIWPSFWKTIGPEKVLAVSEEDARRFGELFGHDLTVVMSNIKFDRLNIDSIPSGGENPLQGLLRSSQEGRGDGGQFVVLGSIREEEEEQISNLIPTLISGNPGVVIGLFPRHMHRIGPWQKRLDRMALSWSLRTGTDESADPPQVVLWDRMGELDSAYGLAQAAFVGGSLAPLGGQNFLEPLACGLRPVIGPYWANFQWIGRSVIEQGLVHEARSTEEVCDLLSTELRQPLDRESIRRQARAYIENRRGGTAKALEVINSIIGN